MSQLRRRLRVKFLPDCEGYVAAPEDVILGKLVYYREGGSDKHLNDIAGIMKRSGGAVDVVYLQQAARSVGVLDVWQSFMEHQIAGDPEKK
jgi:hypothetical protein